MIPKARSTPITFDDLLKASMQKGASDLHLKAGTIPVIRKHGQLRPLSSKLPPLTADQIKSMAEKLMDPQQKEIFEREKDIDIAYGIAHLGRFRINVFWQRGTVRMVARAIPDKVQSLEELNLPESVAKVADFERGLVLVTGATGSGKTSTLAAMIDHINRHKSKHILMIEDPTEFLIRDRRSIITQRELGADTISFAKSLRAALRQDPDVILIGEMRDLETIETALVAAETGHLVLSTLHTLDAQETINRILAIFDQHKIGQVRMQLASVLKAIVSQRLARRKDGNGFVPVVEVLLNNARVAELITNPDRTHEIQKVLEESHEWGMQSFDQSLMEYLTQEIIEYEEAMNLSSHPENFAVRYHGISQMDGKKWAENTAFRQRISEAWSKLSEVELEEQTKAHIKKRKP